MKRKLSITVSALFVLAITALLLKPTEVNAFWHGDNIPEYLWEERGEALHDYLVDNILGFPAPPFPPGSSGEGLQGWLFEGNDNYQPEEQGVTVYNPKKAWKGYTILTSFGGYKPDSSGPTYYALLIDMDGELVNKWDFARGVAKMLPGGYVLGTGGAGPKRTLEQQDWCGSEKVTVYNGRWHHDYQVQGNPVGYYAPGLRPSPFPNKVLILSSDVTDKSYTGHISSNYHLLDDTFYEVDSEGFVLFEWHAWEHFDQSGTDLGMGFDDAAKEAIDSVWVQAGGQGPTVTDWTHMNAVSYVGPNKWYDDYGDLRFHPDNIIFDTRTSNILAIVARYDHPEGEWNRGDIVWRVGPHYSPGYEEHKLGQIIGPHMTHMIPINLPGEGNMLVFDNGGTAGYGSLLPGLPGHYPSTFRDFSRVVEFDPTTLEIVWEYKKTETLDANGDGEITADERKFSSLFISGAQRLQNGNTLITEGGNGRVFEVSKEGEIVWEYISPYAGFVPVPASKGNAIYRAYRVPYNWVPKNLKCD